MTQISSITIPLKVEVNGFDIYKVVDILAGYGASTFNGRDVAVYDKSDIDYVISELHKLKLVADE